MTRQNVESFGHNKTFNQAKNYAECWIAETDPKIPNLDFSGCQRKHLRLSHTTYL